MDGDTGLGLRLAGCQRRPRVLRPYDGTVSAYKARNGTRVDARLPYRSLGSCTIIGGLVYIADLGPGSSNGDLFGLDVGNGKVKWEFHDGKYHPVVAANGYLVVAGNSTLYVMRPLPKS